nr:unnamed protein product [Callosobruchus analis]
MSLVFTTEGQPREYCYLLTLSTRLKKCGSDGLNRDQKAPGRSVTASTDEGSSDSDVDQPLTNDNSDSDLLEDASDDVGAEIEYVLPQNKEVTVLQFVLVKVYGGSRKKIICRYTAIIQQVRVNEEGQK